MRKPAFALFLKRVLGVAILFSISGCENEKRLVFSVGGTPSELLIWEEVVADFEERYGIPVKLHRQPTDTDQRRQSLIVSLTAEQSDPDVFLMDVAWIGLFSASEWLEPLEADVNPFFQRIVQEVDLHENRVVALPVYLDAGVLYYRKDILDEFGLPGPPSTWDELLKYSLQVQRKIRQTNPGFYGFVWQGAQYEGLICNFLEFAGAGGGFAGGDRPSIPSIPENLSALYFMRDLVWKYEISPPSTYTEMKEEDSRHFFQAGNALFQRNWPYAWALHQSDDSRVRGKVGVSMIPAFTGGKAVSTLGGWHVGLSVFSDVKPIAIQFVEYVTSYEVQKKLAFDLGWNPGRKDLYDDPQILSKAPHLTELRNIFEQAVPRPVVPFYTQVSAIAQRRINAVISGNISPEKGLSAANEEIDALLERYGIE